MKNITMCDLELMRIKFNSLIKRYETIHDDVSKQLLLEYATMYTNSLKSFKSVIKRDMKIVDGELEVIKAQLMKRYNP
jgi:hypothetical protein